jgi:hypothetical protein
MRKVFHLAALVLFCASASFAQQPDYPKADFTVGFTLVRINDSGFHENLYGVTLAPAVNINKNVGIEGDFTYVTKTLLGTRVNAFTYMGGPRFTARPKDKKVQPFVHALFGGAHISAAGFSDNGWAAKLGGGLDLVAGKHVAVRVFQIDYVPTHIAGSTNHNMAFTFGVRLF